MGLKDHPDILVSVIIPCYNYSRFLPDSIATLAGQTHENWECIIVDDGSTDDTARVSEELAGKDARIRVIHKENGGPSSARNRGLDVAAGRYIQFLDADDLLMPEKIERQLALLAGTERCALSYTDYRYCHRDDPAITVSRDRFPPPRFTMSRPIMDLAVRWETEFSMPIHGFLFDARFFGEHGIRFDEELGNHEDWDCWMRIFRLDPPIIHVPEPLAIYRLHEDSICSDEPKMLEGYCRALKKQILLQKGDRELEDALEKKLAFVDGLRKASIRERRAEKIRSGVRSCLDRFLPEPLRRAAYSLGRSVRRAGDAPERDKG